jgi:hypothetical protein
VRNLNNLELKIHLLFSGFSACSFVSVCLGLIKNFFVVQLTLEYEHRCIRLTVLHSMPEKRTMLPKNLKIRTACARFFEILFSYSMLYVAKIVKRDI